MPSTRHVALSVPEAQRYADLTGINTDLRDVVDVCDRFSTEHDSSASPDWKLLEVCCTAAIVRYGRTFPSGVRTGIGEEFLSRLSREDQDVHRLFKNLRDKWIAHSVNPFEENQVIVWLAPLETSGPAVVGVAVQETRVTSMGNADMQRLKSLAANLRKIVFSELSKERSKVDRFAKRMDPLPLYSQVEVSSELPNNDAAGKSRRRW